MSNTPQKRSRNINLASMRKAFKVKPVSVAVASLALAACGEPERPAHIYTSADDCASQNPDFAEQCNLSYQDALEEATRTAPKYANQQDCEQEFGPNQCQQAQTSNGGSFFMPFMAGYMLSNLMSSGRRNYYSQPMFTSFSRGSRYRHRWFDAGGRDYGDLRRRSFNVRDSVFKPKPTVNRTLKRGGFGSTARSKSAWGSTRSWGG